MHNTRPFVLTFIYFYFIFPNVLKQILLLSKIKLNSKEILNPNIEGIYWLNVERKELDTYSDIFLSVPYLWGKITFRKISLGIFQ